MAAKRVTFRGTFRGTAEIKTAKKRKKGGGKKMPPRRPKKPAGKAPAGKKAPAAGAGQRPVWRGRGVATGANVKGQRFGARVKRPGIDVTVERGFNVRTKKVGPKKRVIDI